MARLSDLRRIYRIIRFRFHGRPRTISTGLTLAEARAHCADPETSSSTCSAATRRRHPGKWFDGYSLMEGVEAVEAEEEAPARRVCPVHGEYPEGPGFCCPELKED